MNLNSDDALPARLQQALDAMKAPPMPRDAIGPLINRMEHWRTPVARHRRWVWAAASIAASLLIVALWLAWPSDSWAQVVKAMQEKTWIRMSSTGGGESSINWISLPRGIMAWKRGDAVYHDSRLKVIYRYDEAQKTIFRLPEDAESRKTLLANQRLFTGILQNKNELQGTIQERMEVIHQERHDITSDGKKLIEYHLQCRPKDQHDARLAMIFQVDPSTHLAQKLIFKNLTPRSKDEPRELQFQIDYPDKGPLDIYDLGFEKTTKYVDNYPNEDLQRIAGVIRHNREHFDAYRGIVVQGNRLYALIWRKQNKWRVEICKTYSKATPPVPLEDPAAWWLQEATKLTWDATEVCDGRYVYTQDAQNYMPNERSIEKYQKRSFTPFEMERGYASGYLPEIIGYPVPPIGTQIYTVEVKPNQEKGLEGTTLLHARLSKEYARSSARLQRYWIDPTRTYLVMRYDIDEWDDPKQPMIRRQVEKLNRSPSGIWYPEVINGNLPVTMQYYLDFKAELPDKLFTPTERK